MKNRKRLEKLALHLIDTPSTDTHKHLSRCRIGSSERKVFRDTIASA